MTSINASSGAVFRSVSAASVRAGAVLRPTGSRMISAGVFPSCRNCSAIRKRCSSLHTSSGSATCSIPSRRDTVCCNSVCSPRRQRSCLGYCSRESGHKRVPEPPDRITGLIFMSYASGRRKKGTHINSGNAVVRLVPLHEAADSMLDGSAWPETDVFSKAFDIGRGRWHIPILHWQHFKFGLLSQALFQHLDVAHQLDRLVVANIIDTVRRVTGGRVGRIAGPGGVGPGRSGYDTGNSLNNIIDIGEITDHFSVIEYRYGCSFQYALGELEERHVRPSPGAINREEPQAGTGQLVQMRITMRHQFIGLFGCGIEGDRMIHVIVLGKW